MQITSQKLFACLTVSRICRDQKWRFRPNLKIYFEIWALTVLLQCQVESDTFTDAQY